MAVKPVQRRFVIGDFNALCEGVSEGLGFSAVDYQRNER